MHSQLVRFSRAGDQFHYFWAARRCLRLLSTSSGLVAITIEGASPAETGSGEPIEEGEAVIDVAEYYGSEEIANAKSVRYIQLKHSTQHASEPWTPSGIEKTVSGFASRYQALVANLGTATVSSRIEFVFVSNRAIPTDILETVADAAEELTPRHPLVLRKLENFTKLTGPSLAGFCALLHLNGKQEGLWDQRNILAQEMIGYLPDADADAPISLKELVTEKALPESADNPQITKIDVLRALKTDESRLLPTPCMITKPENAIPREMEADLVSEIVNSGIRPILVHAAAGVGKSIFATHIQSGLPEGSLCVVYDCFGNGQYRSASGYRHRHKEALVQIANELARLALSYPLIPTQHADPSAYIRAFRSRLTQSIDSLRSLHPKAILCIAIDAADNAQMAAEELSEPRSFARDLLREPMPEGVRLVFLCRTHRIHHLDPPPSTLHLELKSFSRSETARYLGLSYPDATDLDVDEFHRLSSHNPRVQATAISRKRALPEMLRALGPNPTTVEDTLARFLNDATSTLRDQAGAIESTQIDAICVGLAVLRPLVPIPILAALAQVSEAAIKSFAIDLGRPVVLLGDTIQFFDEPAETWFREQFKPKASEFTSFIERLKPLASNSAYVASTLPQLMLEAGHISELVDLALSSAGLPQGSPVEKRDVELQRLQFALKAVLRAKRYGDAVKLALKAGGETAGDTRLQKLIQENTDLASALMDSNRILEIVSRRFFTGKWAGVHHVYEAGLMSGRSELRGDARSRLRMAHEWLKNWSRLPQAQRNHERVEDADIAELAMAHLNIHGPDACAKHLRGWTAREISFRAGTIVAERLIDQGRFDDLNQLAIAAGNDLGLVLAITQEARDIGRVPPKEAVVRAIRLVQSTRIKLKGTRWDAHEKALSAVTGLVEAAHFLSIDTSAALALVITRYLPDVPPRGLSSPFSPTRTTFLRAYTLRAALLGQTIGLQDVASPDLKEEMRKGNGHDASENTREFRESVGALLPWYQLWADAFVAHPPPLLIKNSMEQAASKSSQAASRYEDRYRITDEIARLRWQIVTGPGLSDRSLVDNFLGWLTSLERPLTNLSYAFLARSAAGNSLPQCALDFASRAFANTKDQRMDAGAKADTYVELANAVFTVSRPEASAYFDQAIDVAGKIGDEHLERWQAILDLADRAANAQPAPEIAYQLSRCAEITYGYVDRDKHFDWTSIVRALVGLCPASSIAILSRWRDRHFGRSTRLLPIAVETLVEKGLVDPRAALAMVGFRGSWDYNELLKQALDSCKTESEKQIAANLGFHYSQLSGQSASAWRTTRDILAQRKVRFPTIEEVVTFAEQAEASVSKSPDDDSRLGRVQNARTETDWDMVFSGLDLHVPSDLSNAYARFRSGEPPLYSETFFRQAIDRIDVGRAAEFIRAFPQVPQFNVYELRNLLQELPERWKSQLSVKSALGDVLKSIARRYCLGISTSRYYEPLPLKFACEICGVAESDILDIVLVAIGDSSELVDARRLFAVVGLLASRMSNSETLDGLRFALTLFDDEATDSDGDGPWSSALAPPPDVHHALAGYVWAALAAPEARIRWEAAHVVRGLCRLEQRLTVHLLIDAARRGLAGPFADARLYFYHRHAREWLVIALARAASESTATVAPHTDFLVHLALNDDPHVVIRAFAAHAGLTLANSGLVTLEPSARDRLARINKSSYPQQSSKRYERNKGTRVGRHVVDDSTRFHFDMDMGPYWFEPLGLSFALPQSAIEVMADRLIIDEWRHSDLTGWEKDERWRRKIFEDRDASYRHTSYPRADDLRFYLSYHALMIIAGRLLASNPLHQDPEDSEDEFESWLHRHMLARADWRWLADRRDADPLERPGWKDTKQDDNWRWSVSKADFDLVLGLRTSRVTIWGDWTAVSEHRLEDIEVRSALVTADKSEALLRALQTTDSPHDYCIPRSEGDSEIDESDFQLRGWVSSRDRANGIDELDLWVGNASYPPLAPAAWVCQQLGLRVDDESRVWTRQKDNEWQDVIWSRTWGHPSERDDDGESEHGERLETSGNLIADLLQETTMSLLIEARIKRRASHSRYERDRNYETSYPPPYTRYFLLNRHGQIWSL